VTVAVGPTTTSTVAVALLLGGHGKQVTTSSARQQTSNMHGMERRQGQGVFLYVYSAI
jgi:hypothetical protein